MLRRFLRLAYFVAVASAWLLVGAIGLEVMERARGVISEWRYADYHSEQNAKVYRMVRAEELASPENQFRLEASQLPAVSAGAVAIPAASTVDCALTPERMAAREAYAARDEESREVILTMYGEFYATLDGDLNLISSDGDPHFERLFKRERVHETLLKLDPTLSQTLMGMTDSGVLGPTDYALDALNVSLTVTHQRQMGVVPRRFDLHLRERSPIFRLPEPPLGPEVSSEIVHVRYKRNWRPEEQMATYNNYGFRDDDVIMPKPEGLYRIVCIGGSTTEEGNSNAETYPNIMERKLQERFGKQRVEVINCGISGITSYNERRRMEDYLALDPDLIVYYNGINDICHEHFATIRAMAPPESRKLLASKLLTRIYNRDLLPSNLELLDFMWESTFRNLRAMALRARECGVEFAVCSFAYPRLDRLNFRDRIYLDMNTREVYHGDYINYASLTHLLDLHNALVRRLSAEERVYYIPAQEQLDAGMDHFFDTCHMTPLGLELKTNIIGAYVGNFIEPRLERLE